MKQTPPGIQALHTQIRHWFFVCKGNTAEIGRLMNQPEHYVDRVIARELDTQWVASKENAPDPLVLP